jgi:hypothetical protein
MGAPARLERNANAFEDLRRELAEVAVAVDQEAENGDRRRVGTALFRSLLAI